MFKKFSLTLNGCFLYITTGYCSVAPGPPLEISLNTSRMELVFEWKKNKCSENNIPDSPARAFRSKDGRVFLYATHYDNVALVGNNLNNVTPSCKHKFSASMDKNPENFDARTWLQTFYTEDGNTIYSLGSSDYHGTWFKNCSRPIIENFDCWWSAIVLSISKDGGDTFSIKSPPHHIVARAPHKFTHNPGRPAGFFTTSNIVRDGKFYYTLIYTYGYKEQKQGNCLIRTDDLSDPSSWRIWDGTGFNRQFVNPDHPNTKTPENHTCTTIDGIKNKVRSLLWHKPTQQYIAVYEVYKTTNNEGSLPDIQFEYIRSRDLLHWSTPEVLYRIKTPRNCEKMVTTGAYPSILNPDSDDRNFGTIDNHGFLYFTRFNSASNCKASFDRDLLRIPLKIKTH